MAVRSANGAIIEERHWPGGGALTHAALLKDLIAWLMAHLAGLELVAVGHRIVHGGIRYSRPQRIDTALLEDLRALCPLAPLHQPHNLAAVAAILQIIPDVPQVACFDTAFHYDKPAVASRLPLPRSFHDRGIRRYGFHGLSYDYVARRLAEVDPDVAAGRVIAGHLGNGASLCAMRAGRSIDTTMGFTALDGLMMGTRCGSLDPGVVLHLQTELALNAAEVEQLLYRESGLLGVSALSSDMRVLSAANTIEAEEAIDLFAWRAAREFGAMAASAGGVDGIVFTAGIGENHADVRRRICQRLEWLGLKIDAAANARNDMRISTSESAVAIYVIPTDEERMIALHTAALLCASDDF